MKKGTKLSLIIVLLALVAAGVFAVIWLDPINKFKNWQADKRQDEVLALFESNQTLEEANFGPATATKNVINSANETVNIKDQVNLPVQFIAQAPLGPGDAHWAVHAESCEEAASLMAHNFISGISTTKEQAEQDIFDLVDWQIDNFGDEHDINADEVKAMAEGYWGHKDVLVINNASVDDLKRQLSAGYPIIVPTIAAHLHNPRYYDQDYHMIIVKGYTSDSFIAHDNGTTWGEDYIYSYDTLMTALDAAGGSVVIIRR